VNRRRTVAKENRQCDTEMPYLPSFASKPMNKITSRRRFLQAAVTLPVLTVAGNTTTSGTQLYAAEKSNSGEVKFSLGLASYSTRKFDRAQTLAICKRSGLPNVCFKDFHLKLTSTDDECKAAAEECRKNGVNLYAGGVIYMKKPEEVQNAFRYAKAAGMTTIVCAPDPPLLPQIDELVKETGIYIAVHNHGPGDKIYPTPESIIEKVGGLDKRIGLCIDVGHTARIGGDVIGSIKKFKDRIFEYHFKDETEATPRGKGCICGWGALDLPGYLAAVKESGYDRVVSFEYEIDENDPLPGLMASVGYVRGVLRML
jgi:sugar phosphate isomerase/epimerase